MILAIGKRAFSLVELLVAITILSIGIVTVLQALSISSRVAGLSFDLVNANFLAENKMQEWEFKEKQGLINKELPAAEDKIGKFTWQYTLNLDPDLKLYHLNFELNWERANRQEKFNLNTCLRQ